jgi:hypothetical protein
MIPLKRNKIIFFRILLVIMMLNPFRVPAQDTKSEKAGNRSRGIKINPLSLAAGAGSLFVEVPLKNPTNDLQFGCQFWTGVIPLLYDLSFQRMWGITACRRHFFSGHAPEGGFVEIFGRINNLWDAKDKGSVLAYTLGVTFGKQRISAKNVSFELFAGPYYCIPTALGFVPSYDSMNGNSKTITDSNPYNGFWIRAGITIGIFTYQD